MASLPQERQDHISADAAQMLAEIEGLDALRKLAMLCQEQIAQSLGIKRHGIAKIGRQTDLYLSTLRRFIEAAGGTLELRVALPGTGALTLTGVGEIEGKRAA